MKYMGSFEGLKVHMCFISSSEAIKVVVRALPSLKA